MNIMRLGTYYRYLVTQKLKLPLSGETVLDVGCHDGFLLSTIDANKKVGIDLNCVEKYSNIHYIKSDFLTHNFNDKFDRVFALDVIEHVRDDEKFILKIEEILDVKGIAILSTPNKNIKIFPSFLQSWVDEKWQHQYRRGYTPKEIEEILITNKNSELEMNIIEWNCPFFRFFYLPVNFLWRIVPQFVSGLLKFIINIDFRFKNGHNGFLYILIENY